MVGFDSSVLNLQYWQKYTIARVSYIIIGVSIWTFIPLLSYFDLTADAFPEERSPEAGMTFGFSRKGFKYRMKSMRSCDIMN
ncbi:predicted protein [Methanosarcina acetivorans C2A]|uniref:Uncharacterized protein n=1 Tax=Methanosarcina acetivorans (strain ATCC 35395 / DSM 2834 / JCM 12185 / C2A) TaxID=188937 RepID=Q8TLJ5_METAC|nr:predicted protein [Methanosarcina acetivorans C2A]